MSLKYAGDGRFLIGIPADDLEDDALEALAAERNTQPTVLRKSLVDSGIYKDTTPAKPEKKGGAKE